MNKQSLLILGATGTIGVNTLDVVKRHPDRFDVYGLVAGKNIELLFQQAQDHRPQVLVICDDVSLSSWKERRCTERLHQALGYIPDVLDASALSALCAHPRVDTVVAAIVGAAGLQPTLDALHAGKRVLLANKESLVLAGQFMMDAARQSGAVLLPVDSEHNAIFQCLPPSFHISNMAELGVERLLLTASGGPFRTVPLSKLQHVTPAQAVAHPNWVMGRKISVDSATMANKGLELIEALWMFGLPPQQLSVLIHPQSIVHSLVEYKDGSLLAQLGYPDMRTPIAHVLGWPDRIESGVQRLNLAQIAQLEFQEPDFERFPMLKLAFQVLENPSVLAPVFNAANEIAVEQFLNEQLAYLDIIRIVDLCLERFAGEKSQSLEDAFALDQMVRVHALTLSSQLVH
jgi:1-deoxy-D-xylulose-5-phosphate reductoisomerase